MWNRVTIQWQIYSQKRKIYMRSDISEEVVKNRYKHLGQSNWLGKPLYIMLHTGVSSLPFAFAPSGRQLRIPPSPFSRDLTPLTLSRPGAILTSRTSHPCTFCDLMPLTPTCPSGPRDHSPLTPWQLAHRQAPRDAETSRPSCPSCLSHGSWHLRSLCHSHAHLLSSSPAPSDWQEVTRAGLLKTFASGTASELDLAPLGQAGGGSSLETLWTLPALAPEDWVKWIQVEHGREDMCS